MSEHKRREANKSIFKAGDGELSKRFTERYIAMIHRIEEGKEHVAEWSD